jgi:AcrR family transcriptional regulator
LIARSPEGRMSLSIACTEERVQSSKLQDILNTAWIHFSANGFAGSSINAITREAGVSKESMYRYFTGKEDLFEAVLDQELAHYARSIDCLIASIDAEDEENELFELGRGILGVLCSRRTIVLRKLLGQKHPSLVERHKHREFFACTRRVHAAVEKLLTCQNSTPFGPDTLAEYFLSMLLYKNILERDCSVLRSPSDADIARLARTAVRDFDASFLSR